MGYKEGTYTRLNGTKEEILYKGKNLIIILITYIFI